MTGKQLLLHPFINRDTIARYMYPERADAVQLLRNKVSETGGECFNDQDEALALDVLALLLRAMMQPDGQAASADPDCFSDN